MLPGLSENQVAFVSKRDVAAALAGCLVTEQHAGATYNLSRPAAISGAERAAMVSEASSKPLSFMVLTEEQFRCGRAQGKLLDFLVDTFVAMQKAFSNGAHDIVTGDIERLSGQPPRACVSRVLAPNMRSSMNPGEVSAKGLQ